VHAEEDVANIKVEEKEENVLVLLVEEVFVAYGANDWGLPNLTLHIHVMSLVGFPNPTHRNHSYTFHLPTIC